MILEYKHAEAKAKDASEEKKEEKKIFAEEKTLSATTTSFRTKMKNGPIRT